MVDSLDLELLDFGVLWIRSEEVFFSLRDSHVLLQIPLPLQPCQCLPPTVRRFYFAALRVLA